MADPVAAKPDEDRTRYGLFAVTNVAELLERSAYYGFVSVFGLYLDSLGYGGAVIGAVGAILLSFPYVIPLLSAVIAEKVGYKPVVVLALVLYAGGFAVVASLESIAGILTGILLVATGAGGFKPIATASIAHVTSEKHRSLGFTIYYTGINVGGFLGPLTVAFLTDSFRAGFLVALSIMLACLLLTLVFFRNPVPPQKETSVKAALAKLGAIKDDRRLALLLVIFSGFWFLYSMNFSFLALYLDRFVDLPSWFEANLQQSYNPLIVIFLGIPIGAFATKQPPRRMMTIGILLYVVGFSVVGFIPFIAAFFVGLFVATVGEILAYPAFLSYLSRIAPKDRVAVYQSYGFVPLFIGFFFGPLAMGSVYQALAVDAGRPALFWAVPITVGVLALFGFLALAAHDLAPGKPRRTGYGKAALVLLVAPLLFIGAALAGSQAAQQESDGAATDVALASRSGTATEGQTQEETFTIPDDAVGNLTFTLRWQDEPPGGTPGASNQPDTFQLLARAGSITLDSAEAANNPGGQGEIVVVVDAALARSLGGNLTLEVTLVDSGEQVATVPLLGPQTLAQDTGNAWELLITKQVPVGSATS